MDLVQSWGYQNYSYLSSEYKMTLTFNNNNNNNNFIAKQETLTGCANYNK
jgi:hypothetical protein